MRKLFKLLKSKPLFTRVLLALFVSGLGTAFTSVAVYQQLAAANWGPLGFALAFAAGILPGMLTSTISGRHYARWPVGKFLIYGQFIGLVALVFPLIGSWSHQVVWLIVAEVIASAVGGLLFPLFKGLERSSFSEDEFQLLASLDTFMLTANFIFGQGLAALLISFLSIQQFLLLDAASYMIAIGLLIPVVRALGTPLRQEAPEAPARTVKWIDLSPPQKSAILLFIWLPLVTAPLIVVLPARGAEFGLSANFIGLAITPALLLICGRTIGQILGPLLAMTIDMSRLSQRTWSLSLSLLVFITAYAVAFVTPSLLAAVALCMLAHIASNVVYAVCNFQLMKAFEAEQIGWAAGLIYRVSTFAMGVIGIGAGALAGHFGWSSVVAVSTLTWLVGGIFWRTNVLRA